MALRTLEEAAARLAAVEPRFQLVARLLYGSGLRLGERVRLRVKNLDFDAGRWAFCAGHAPYAETG